MIQESLMPEANRQQTLQQLEHEIYNVLGSRITAKRSAREAHSEDEAYHRGLPDLVVFPQSPSNDTEIP